MKSIFARARKGFTLIEVLIYIGLFSILVVGSLGIAYEIMETITETRERVAINQEIVFVMQKLKWILQDVESLETLQSQTGTSTHLVVYKRNYQENPISISLASSTLFIAKGQSPPAALTSPGLNISDFQADIVEGTVGHPFDAVVTISINGTDYKLQTHIWIQEI